MPARPWEERATRAVALAGFVALALPVFHFATRPLGGGDVFWQVRTGETILRTGVLPDVDTYSYTVAGAAWNNHEWGYEVLVALVVRALGLGGLRWMVLALAGGCIAGVVWAVARRATAAWGLLAGSLLLLCATYKFIPAPQTASMALFLAGWELFFREGLFARGYRAVALLGYLVMWANFTAEVLIFLPFLLADQVPRVVRSKGEARIRGAVGLVLACAVPLCTPRSSSVLEYALVGSAVNRAVNGEFGHLWEPAQTIPAAARIVGWCVVLAFVGWVAVRLRASTDWWKDGRRVALGLLAVAAAVTFERNLWLLVIPAGQMALDCARWARRTGRVATADMAAIALAAVLLVTCASGIGWTPALAWRHITARGYWSMVVDPGAVPVACGAVVGDLPPGARVFTDRTWASYVIWRAPQVRVFIDGRNREYPLVVHRAATEAWAGGAHTLRILAVSGTDWVLATPGWGVLPGVRGGPWQRVAQASTCAVYGRAAR